MEGCSGEEASWKGQPFLPFPQRHRAGLRGAEPRPENTNSWELQANSRGGLGQTLPGWASGFPLVK